jgi:hypothetical protein
VLLYVIRYEKKNPKNDSKEKYTSFEAIQVIIGEEGAL